MGALWACWIEPLEPLESDALLLSFLPPGAEDALAQRYGGRLLRAREVSRPLRKKSLELYVDRIARLGLLDRGDGLTFRQALRRPGEASRWWYHPVAFRDCESDPAFEQIIAIQTLVQQARDRRASKLVLWGAPPEIAEALRTALPVECRRPRGESSEAALYLRGLGSRVLWALRLWRQSLSARSIPAPQGTFDVVLSGFWDWSFWRDEKSGSFEDRYFKRLPAELTRGRARVAWFAWLDPDSNPGKPRRRMKDALSPLLGREDVVLLQSFLSPLEILRALLDARPLLEFLRLRKRPEFRRLFLDESVDYYPLFSRSLLRGFLNASLPRGVLTASAAERAFCRHRPKVSLSFLEHNPYSRAYYEGARRAGTDSVCAAVQHCSYSHEKTFIFLHPSLEFQDTPDGCDVPHPRDIFAMGTLGREIFLECGYPAPRVHLTGSTRYDHVLATTPAPRRSGEEVRVLIVSSLDVSVEIEMVEAACLAAGAAPNIRLALRDHPFSRIEDHPRFRLFARDVRVTRGALEEDLAEADIVLFTYSTVAEEALLQGKPVWQWLPLSYNASALAEAADIPRFASAMELRRALLEFRADRARFLPAPGLAAAVRDRLFAPADGLATRRIAETVLALR